nr:hypothetical protein [Croceicoccus sediminis]
MNSIQDFLAQSRAGELDEDADYGIESIFGPLPFGQISVSVFDLDASPFGKASRFIQSLLRDVRGDNAMHVLGKEDAVSPFAGERDF